MSSAESVKEVSSSTEVLFKGSISSTSSHDTPSVESSFMKLEMEDSPKMKLYKQGLYNPGTGEICADYITLSDSAVLNHPYYEYPGVKDPGIVKALMFPEEDKVYDFDGQELYLDLCKEMKVMPVRCFYRGLKENNINLRYYGVNPSGIKAMCLALAYNKSVTTLDLTSNFLEGGDACFHLGELLGYRSGLEKLVLNGCRVGHEGMKRLVVYLHSRNMKLLDLTGNNIQDEGFTYLAEAIEKGAIIKYLNLRNNDLTSDSLLLLSEVLAYNDSTTHLDLSWNKFYKVRGPTALFRRLGHSQMLVELNMSWTGLCVCYDLRNLLRIETLKVLNLSNNRLPSLAAKTIGRALSLATNLKLLDLSCNPFSQGDALFLLVHMRQQTVTLNELRMDHIVVNKEFAEELKDIMKLEFRKNTIITHGEVLRNYTLPESDLKIITLRRFVMSTKKKRKMKLDVLSYFLELNKTRTNFEPNELIRTLKIHNAPINNDLIEDLMALFPGPKTDKGWRTINLISLVDYIHRLWPNKKPPPTPPPTPPPAPTPPPKKGKDKKKKKK